MDPYCKLNLEMFNFILYFCYILLGVREENLAKQLIHFEIARQTNPLGKTGYQSPTDSNQFHLSNQEKA